MDFVLIRVTGFIGEFVALLYSLQLFRLAALVSVAATGLERYCCFGFHCVGWAAVAALGVQGGGSIGSAAALGRLASRAVAGFGCSLFRVSLRWSGAFALKRRGVCFELGDIFHRAGLRAAMASAVIHCSSGAWSFVKGRAPNKALHRTALPHYLSAVLGWAHTGGRPSGELGRYASGQHGPPAVQTEPFRGRAATATIAA